MQGKIKKIHNMLAKREISAIELTRKYLDYIVKHNPDINAYVNITEAEAMIKAKAIDNMIQSGEDVPLLAGIPMTVKDCICTKGITTTCSSKILSGYKPIYDAFAYKRLYEEGAVLLGKTNMDEFAMGSTCESSCYGPTINPHNLTCVSGGSSGGGAAAVAADIAVYALGSDTGGSVRQPASFCGIVGLKPTYGAVSRNGLIAYASSFDQIGIMTQSVEDAAIVFDSISAFDEDDETCSSVNRTSVSAKIYKDINGLRIGILKNLYNNLNPSIETALHNAIKIYEGLGAKVEEFEIEQLELSLPVYYILACAEASSNLARYDGVRYGYRSADYSDFKEMVSKTRDEGFGTEVKRRIMLGNYVLRSGYYDAYYKRAQLMRDKLCRIFSRVFENIDIIITPTVASTAFKLGEMSKASVEMYLTDMCTVTANICGLPAISIPCGFDENNMPIGMQLISNKFCEDTILNAAYVYEDKKYNMIYKKPIVGGECLG